MMNIISRYKNILIIGLVVVVAFFGYSFFFTNSSDTVLQKNTTGASATIDNELIALLLQLKSLKLDDSIFSDTTFKSLEDFSQELVSEPVGRVNPFAPFGANQ